MEANVSLESQFIFEHQLLKEYCGRRKPWGKPRGKPRVAPMCAAPQQEVMRKRKSSNERCLLETDSSDDTHDVRGVADNLVQIVDSTPLVQDQIVSQSGVDVIQRLVELLKESGDELNEKIQKDRVLLGYLQSSFSYTVFEQLASAFIGSPMPSQSQNQNADEQKKQIAWTFEMTSRLTALDLQPMNRAMGFGAQYLHQNFAQWIQQNGGWEKVFKRDESDE
ncbi:apoptosis facilitator Bcl-2-like protein 14 [Astyanax mexicanus]|uniref:Apoptosis facilitator Bcl-2-like protein 14 n=1 Tax=Astyanax mexicanus TaxID=7994 RepID=A0A8T2KHR9_ASTMX|nr:apoptosis facilitator Bcl-2-like protein 14 [Astyanax mexicanus]